MFTRLPRNTTKREIFVHICAFLRFNIVRIGLNIMYSEIFIFFYPDIDMMYCRRSDQHLFSVGAAKNGNMPIIIGQLFKLHIASIASIFKLNYTFRFRVQTTKPIF